MARARNIKPQFFLNEDLAELSPIERLFFIGLWTIADYKGCLEYRPKRLKATLIPYDDIDLERAVKNLSQYQFIRSYFVGERQYIKIVNFERHQNPHKNEREAGSDIPDEPVNIETEAPQIAESHNVREKPEKIGTKTETIGTARADSLNTDSLNTDSLRVVAPRDARTARAKGTRLPDQFSVTAQMVDWARSRAPAVNLSDETEKFRNYYQAATGPNAVRMDWAATWRNWILNAKEFNGNGKNRSNGGGKRTDADVFAESADFYANFPDAAVDHA